MTFSSGFTSINAGKLLFRGTLPAKLHIQWIQKIVFSSWSIAVEAKFSQRLSSLSEGDIPTIIQMAWDDRTAFETIQQRMGWSEADVIRLMRHELQPNSFRLWRKRMKGLTTKHRALRSPEMKFEDRLVADHRRANC